MLIAWKVNLKSKHSFVFVLLLLFILYFFGVFTHLFEKSFNRDFHYPYDGNVEILTQQLRKNVDLNIAPINSYNYNYSKNPSPRCAELTPNLVFLVKSSPENFVRRAAIRSSWGNEKRFEDIDIVIRTFFLLGTRNDKTLQRKIDEEHTNQQDLVEGNFTDAYYNSTYKMMMGLAWATNFCKEAQFYMIVDDDYYISTKNLLGFISNPMNYPYYKYPFEFHLKDNVILYSGFVFNSSPLRHLSSKWYVPLSEYPYDKWPPYVTAGSVVLSREALFEMYYASFYTEHFRFDDIYLALLAYKVGINPFHSKYFHFHYLEYSDVYSDVIASHGWGDPRDLLTAWSHQKSLGNA